MLLLLSPAKALDYDTPAGDVPHTQPQFVPQSAELIEILRQKSPQDIAQLMHLSDTLSGLNVARYQAWTPKFTAKNAKQAVLAFNGDVYGGLDAKTLDTKALAWLQEHVGILSGLYGVLRPLDYMQPYRLEMGTQLANARGKNLYEFWGSQIAEHLNTRLKKDAAPVIVNLASVEYFKAVDRTALKARVVECVFEEYKSGKYKIVSFHAKRARGLMARFAAVHALKKPEQLVGFDAEGYAYDAGASTPDRLVFRRRGAD
ncbi:peroxide stress protein YaaA [Rhodoferax sp. U2-2l]|uniref:peroxide stress protein YaaA n=1 Tax=Rhodoferax sp. U2-2l TaxID=2884000 RepID=UPI001D0B41D6|nr:peroxide stress protein YaaA [Rhodoferax sp. U2-2l]MCB8748372.1 peroxide stress protein YaaA [Rhodoferax sp. U2-2l]